MGRVCNKCLEYKPWDSFSLNSKGKNGRKSVCKDCFNVYQKALSERRKKEDPEKFRQDRYHKNLKYILNISVEDYEDLLKKSGGVCNVCGKSNGKKRLNVDHCHVTGEIRGLLCTMCNTSIGKLGDNSEGLLKAYNYLVSFERRLVEGSPSKT